MNTNLSLKQHASIKSLKRRKYKVKFKPSQLTFKQSTKSKVKPRRSLKRKKLRSSISHKSFRNNSEREENKYQSLIINMNKTNHPLAQYPLNDEFHNQLYHRNKKLYLDLAFKQSQKILKDSEFSYNDYNKVFKKEIISKKKEQLRNDQDFKGTLDDFRFPNKSLNNKKILVLMGHSSICEYYQFKSLFKKSPKQDILSRTDNVDKHLFDIQILSTQTLGRPGYQIFYEIFYKLLNNDIWHDALLELETQSDAENLNFLFKYLYTFYKKYDYDFLIKDLYGEKFKGKKEITNFRIYPKNTQPKYPLDQLVSFYPQRKDEIRGLYDFTTIKVKGKFKRFSLIMEYMGNIKKCFQKQINSIYLNNSKTNIILESQQELHLKKIQTALLIPNEETIKLLKLEFNSLKTNGTPKPTIESFLDELKYNFAIYNLYHKEYKSYPKRSLRNFNIKLSALIQITREVFDQNDDILLVENTCKQLNESEFVNSNVRDLSVSQKIDPTFNYQSALIAKRSQSRDTNQPQTVQSNYNNIFLRKLYIDILKKNEHRVYYDKNCFSKINENPQYKKNLEEFTLKDFKKLIAEFVDVKSDIESDLLGRKILSYRGLKCRDELQNNNLIVYILKKIINTFG